MAHRSHARRVVVFGATGMTGRRVVDRLVADGVQVRALCRSEPRGFPPEVEIHRGDIRDPTSLVGVGRGMDAAICCVGTRSYFGSNGGAAVDALGTRHLVEALREPAPHFVLLGAFGLDRQSPFLAAFSLLLNRYFHWKAEAEAAVRQSGLRYTIVRPVELRERPPRSPPLVNQRAPLSLLRTVSRELVADVLVACAGNPAVHQRTFELCEGGDGPLADQLARLVPDDERPLPEATPLF
ncbi:MAG: NAD(P)H-binding protein [Polyangiaceae bacterium]